MTDPAHLSDPFPQALLDRRSADRGDAAALAELWEHPEARFLLVRDGQVCVPTGRDDAAAVATLGRYGRPDVAQQRRVLLGVDDMQLPWWLCIGEGAAPPEGMRWVGLRTIGPLASAVQVEALMTAVALESWHERHGFCPRCGHATEPTSGGWVRRCTADGTEHYPRTDPAVIVLVIDEEDRALLGRQTRWPAFWRSALAGFVEPGERAESAVRREVAEEVGIRLDRVHYVGSQPWPFPGSLMLGFHAWTSDTDVVVDGEEIAQAEWYSREQLVEAAAAGTIQLPPAISIARGLIERWFGRPLPGSWLRT